MSCSWGSEGRRAYWDEVKEQQCSRKSVGGGDIEMEQGSGSVTEGQKGVGDIEMKQRSSSVAEGQKRGGDIEMRPGSSSVVEG